MLRCGLVTRPPLQSAPLKFDTSCVVTKRDEPARSTRPARRGPLGSTLQTGSTRQTGKSPCHIPATIRFVCGPQSEAFRLLGDIAPRKAGEGSLGQTMLRRVL